MSDFTETYRGASISYSVENNDWIVRIDNNALTPRKSLKLARSAVDETFKREGTFLKHPALLMQWGGIISCTVTSYVDPEDQGRHAGGKTEAWVKKEDGSREKTDIQRLREDTEGNRELLRQVIEAKKQEDHFASLRHILQEKLTPYVSRQTPK